MAKVIDKNILLTTLGSRLRTIRESLGMTQESLANEAGLDRSYIGGVERGERNISFLILCRIASALKIDIASLTKGMPENRYD